MVIYSPTKRKKVFKPEFNEILRKRALNTKLAKMQLKSVLEMLVITFVRFFFINFYSKYHILCHCALCSLECSIERTSQFNWVHFVCYKVQ